MNEGMISKRYAKALLLYAAEQKTESAVYSEMKKLAAVFTEVPQLRMAMENPMATANDKTELVKAAVGGEASELLVRFVELVIKKRREVYLHKIALCYTDLYCEANHLNTGKLVTATPLDKAAIDKMKTLAQKIKPGDLDFETKVDPTIEGGFILYIDTYRLDASVASQLKRIKQQFSIENSKIA